MAAMPRVVVPRTAKQAFISLFSSVPSLLAVDAVRRAIRARRGDRVGWVLAAAVHALPGAYFANGFLRPAARTSPNAPGGTVNPKEDPDGRVPLA
jgi:hypothetical protein